MKQDLKRWLSALVLAFLAAALTGGAIFAITLPPVEDKSQILTAETLRWTEQAETLDRQLQAQELTLEQARGELEYWEQVRQTVAANKTDYDELLALQTRLPAAVDAVRADAGLGELFAHTVPPNYDRRCLTYLQSGNKVNTFASGLLGGALGKAFGHQTQNMTQADVGTIHGEISRLTDEINEDIQAAEQSLAALCSGASLIDLLYDPELTGAEAEGQVRFWELYQQQEEMSAALWDVARAAKTLECAIPVYATYLSESAENRSYLQLLNSDLDKLRRALDNHNMAVEDCLSPEDLNNICQKAVRWHRGLGLAIQNSEIWLETKTMQSSLLGTGRQAGMAVGDHKMLVTWRTTDQKIMYATDPKGDITAFYGFTQDGNPLCFSRGDQYILFDWNAGDGSVLASTYSDSDASVLYQFSCFLRDNRNGFRNTQYNQYQRVY